MDARLWEDTAVKREIERETADYVPHELNCLLAMQTQQPTEEEVLSWVESSRDGGVYFASRVITIKGKVIVMESSKG